MTKLPTAAEIHASNVEHGSIFEGLSEMTTYPAGFWQRQIEKTEATRSVEYTRGFRAFVDGRPASANPHKTLNLRDQWAAGWHMAETIADHESARGGK